MLRCAFSTPCAVSRPLGGWHTHRRGVDVRRGLRVHSTRALRACASAKPGAKGDDVDASNSKWAFDYIPPHVKRMDEEEVARQLRDDAPLELDAEVLDKLHQEYPHLKLIDEMFDKYERQAESDPEYDPQKPYSYMYLKTRPWNPSPVFKGICAAILAYIVYCTCKYLISCYAPLVLATAVLRIDLLLLIVLGVMVPILLIARALIHGHLFINPKLRYDPKKSEMENKRNYDILISESYPIDVDGRDAVIRCATMVIFTVIGLTLPSMLLASVGATQSALSLEIILRAALLPMALWGWRDLRADFYPEGNLSPTPEVSKGLLAQMCDISELVTPQMREASEPLIARARNWRAILTLQCILGSILRICAIYFPDVMPLQTVLESTLSQVRSRLGDLFPVAFSLARDPGGVICLAWLLVVLATCNALHLYMGASEFGDIKEHRLVPSMLSNAMVRVGLYDSKEVWMDRQRVPSSAPDGCESYKPSPVMLLLPRKRPLFNTGMMVQQERQMAALELLADEERNQEKMGVEHWVPPRDQWVTPKEGIPIDLNVWANEGNDKSFKDFFEMVNDRQFDYDPDQGKWVFTDENGAPKKPQNGKSDNNHEASSANPITDVENISKKEKGTSTDGTPKIPNREEDGNETVYV